LRKPTARCAQPAGRLCRFEIPPDFVVGWGLDYAERYRNLRGVYGSFSPETTSEAASPKGIPAEAGINSGQRLVSETINYARPSSFFRKNS